MKKRPHIVIFNPDQFRVDALGHLGNEAAVTPNLDRLVETDAVSFQNAFCQNPVCTPSRCSFMSGWYPHVRGHRTIFHMLQDDERVLLRDLKEDGYFVFWAGKNDLVPAENSFDKYCNVKYQPKRQVRKIWKAFEKARGEITGDNYYSFYVGKIDKGEADHFHDDDWENIYGALEFIKIAPKDQPFCIYLPLVYPHPPYAVEDPWYSMIDRNKVPDRIPTPVDWSKKPKMLKGIYERQNLQNWTEDRWKELQATYLGMCARVDHQFGLIIQALKDAGVYDDTAIFLFSDHGDFTGDYGLVEKTQNTFEDSLTNVPFIFKPPKDYPVKPGISDALVELIDFPATVEALTGIVPKHTHFGKSLLPLVTGEKTDHRDAVFCEGGRLFGETHCMELEANITPQSPYWPRVGLQYQETGEHTKAVMIRTKEYKYVMRLYEQDEFYDLVKDPQELNNEIDNPEYQHIILSLKERLLRFFLETGDVVPHKPNKRS